MNIEFGQVQHSEPEHELRPDRNAQFATCIVGEIGPDDLPIYVDLDAMRDMEAHSQSDTRVELGGVMLGQQRVDAQGNPFVVITESLRAEHYHATKGSFTFTHDTWSEITRRRAEFHPDLEMVGWYHTHPGWNVFLSGMDNFICDNFFNRLLDVALVIDPCLDDRGWFQWETERDADGNESQATRRTSGFVLVTGRHRTEELKYFADLYARKNDMSNDPRYSNVPARETIQLVQTPRGNGDYLLIGILMLQMMFMAGLTYWMITASANMNGKQTTIDGSQQQTIRQQAQAELLERVVAGQAGNGELATEFAQLKEQEYLLRSSLDGQLARLEKESTLRTQVETDLEQSNALSHQLQIDLENTKSKLSYATQQIEAANAAATEAGSDQTESSNSWLLLLAGALSLLAAGGLFGYSYNSRQQLKREQFDVDEDTDSHEVIDSNTADIDFNKNPVATH